MRLKVATTTDLPYTSFSFQFQTGAIKSEWQFVNGARWVTFQFQTGAIKSSLNGLINPTGNRTFQFQTGAIKSADGADSTEFAL